MIVLIGFMGAGKTSVAHALAALLAQPAVDLDDRITAAAACSIPAIFAAEGEAGFRAREHAALTDVLETDVIVATGGGTPLQAANNALLQASTATIVHLDATFSTIYARVAGDTNRPLVAKLSGIELEQLYTQRRPVYANLATITVDTSALTAAETARAIVREMKLG